MKIRKYKLIFFLIASLLLLGTATSVFAAELQSGSVKGLPEKLVVLDDSGNSVSESGEYFFVVEGMTPDEVYTKNIQIMNLRDDASYKIYFSAQPMSKNGEIDLENECVCDIHLDDELIYSGKVTGDGKPNIMQDPLELGSYDPGDKRTMKVEIKWIPDDSGGLIDNGERVYDSSGMTVVREPSGKKEIYGETVFKWIFRAEVKGMDKTIKTGDVISLIAIGAVAVAMLFIIILTIGKRKKQSKT